MEKRALNQSQPKPKSLDQLTAILDSVLYKLSNGERFKDLPGFFMEWENELSKADSLDDTLIGNIVEMILYNNWGIYRSQEAEELFINACFEKEQVATLLSCLLESIKQEIDSFKEGDGDESNTIDNIYSKSNKLIKAISFFEKILTEIEERGYGESNSSEEFFRSDSDYEEYFGKPLADRIVRSGHADDFLASCRTAAIIALGDQQALDNISEEINSSTSFLQAFSFSSYDSGVCQYTKEVACLMLRHLGRARDKRNMKLIFDLAHSRDLLVNRNALYAACLYNRPETITFLRDLWQKVEYRDDHPDFHFHPYLRRSSEDVRADKYKFQLASIDAAAAYDNPEIVEEIESFLLDPNRLEVYQYGGVPASDHLKKLFNALIKKGEFDVIKRVFEKLKEEVLEKIVPHINDLKNFASPEGVTDPDLLMKLRSACLAALHIFEEEMSLEDEDLVKIILIATAVTNAQWSRVVNNVKAVCAYGERPGYELAAGQLELLLKYPKQIEDIAKFPDMSNYMTEDQPTNLYRDAALNRLDGFARKYFEKKLKESDVKKRERMLLELMKATENLSSEEIEAAREYCFDQQVEAAQMAARKTVSL